MRSDIEAILDYWQDRPRTHILHQHAGQVRDYIETLLKGLPAANACPFVFQLRAGRAVFRGAEIEYTELAAELINWLQDLPEAADGQALALTPMEGASDE